MPTALFNERVPHNTYFLPDARAWEHKGLGIKKQPVFMFYKYIRHVMEKKVLKAYERKDF